MKISIENYTRLRDQALWAIANSKQLRAEYDAELLKYFGFMQKMQDKLINQWRKTIPQVLKIYKLSSWDYQKLMFLASYGEVKE